MSEQEREQLNSESSQALANAAPQKSKLSKVVDVVLWVLIAVLTVAVLVRVFLFTQITVSGESMMETLHDEDVVSVSKVAKLNRGDVVVFYKQDGTNKFFDVFASRKEDDNGKNAKLIKRAVAVAGDKLWVEKVDETSGLYKVVVKTPDGTVLHEDCYEHDGDKLAEEIFYIKEKLSVGSDLGLLAQHVGEANALVIEDGYFFAMGDNRSNSSDSRAFGAVPTSRLYGVVIK